MENEICAVAFQGCNWVFRHLGTEGSLDTIEFREEEKPKSGDVAEDA